LENDKQQYLERLGFVRWVPRDRIQSLLTENTGLKTSLENLAEEVDACKLCSLHETRKNTVFGVGNLSAEWMFVGEVPGSEKDRQGLPFGGRAGELLDAMIVSVGMERDDVYVVNLLKCRPSENRDPLGIEVQSCEGCLQRQIKLVEPRLIVALGPFAAQSLLKSSLPIGKLRGREHSYVPFEIPLVATYHPAYLLRSPLEKRKVWSDLLLAKSILL